MEASGLRETMAYREGFNETKQVFLLTGPAAPSPTPITSEARQYNELSIEECLWALALNEARAGKALR